MPRTDVVVVGEVGGLLCSMYGVYGDSSNRLLYPLLLYSNINSNTSAIVASQGTIANGVVGTPTQISMMYARPRLVSSADGCRSITVTIELYSDTDGVNSLGYVGLERGGLIFMTRVDSPFELNLISEDPCQTSTTDIVASCRYTVDTTSIQANSLLAFYVYPCLPLTNGLCAGPRWSINNPERTTLTTAVSYIMFVPLTYYVGERCTISNNSEGYLPSALAYSQCSYFPGSGFNLLSSTCNPVVRGYSNPGYCGSDIFSYGDSEARCNDQVTYTNLLGLQVTTNASGLCNSGFCVGVGNYSCRNTSNTPSPEVGDVQSDSDATVFWSSVIAVIVVSVVVVVIVYLLYKGSE